ncbi:deaminase domain-containing protein [Actinoplanes sp. L3-i22]|uniref:deaminase domain-containing protein n=1 Tax=Actinoplanes sp. L3-i22 TaxID=2836373 RepID=UPI001C862D8B|nr:deaminase domain-containing protein [Actinoplanes sp. L3-i22]
MWQFIDPRASRGKGKSKFDTSIYVTARKPKSLRYRLIPAVVMGVVASQFVVPQTAQAEESTSPSPRLQAAIAWQSGGDSVRAAAAAALVGSDADLAEFLDTGWAEGTAADQRAAVLDILGSGGPAVQSAAQTALDSTDAKALTTFLQTGFAGAQDKDTRVRANQMLATSGPLLHAAVQKALDLEDVDALGAFLDTGWQHAFYADQRIQVLKIMQTGGKEVRAAAQRALDSENVNVLTEFIESGWAVATARDEETSSLTDLVNATADAGKRAAAATQEAKDQAAKAKTASASAKKAAQTAASEADQAGADAQRAARAAQQAAQAAKSAAASAKIAVNAAAAAERAAHTAASAATRAAAAAAATARKATDAQKAAGDAATDATKAGTARDAATKARDMAKATQKIADAAGQAGDAAVSAGEAALASVQAAADSVTAAANALAALEKLKATGKATAEAINAARRAKAQAERATQAANDAAAYANKAAQAAYRSKQAAASAITHALAAATAADEAADHAADANTAATRATTAANAATDAANEAVTAAESAQDVYDAARLADEERLAILMAEGEENAQDQSAAYDQAQHQIDWSATEADKRTAETNALIAAVKDPQTPSATAVTDARKVALNLAQSDSAWTRTTAIQALSADDEQALDFVNRGITLAAAQDDRATLQAMADSGSEALAKAANSALDGSDADVTVFLKNPTYPGLTAEDRTAVLNILAAAKNDGNVVTAQKAQAALDSESHDTIHAFVTSGQFVSAAADDRVRANNILADATSGPELKAQAQIALDSPPTILRSFLATSQYAARQKDYETASHNAEVLTLVNQAKSIAFDAVRGSQEAQRAAALARKDGNAATTWANAAAQSAKQAATYANNAIASANDAEKSASQAQVSAKTASDAATAARKSSAAASRSAVWAQTSLKNAKESAKKAVEAAQAAHDSAVDAKKSADEAKQAYTDAYNEVVNREKARIKNDRAIAFAVCTNENWPLPPNPDCIALESGVSQEMFEQGLANSSFCGRVHPQGSALFNSCVAHAFSPNFSTFEALNFADMELSTMKPFAELDLMFAGGLFCAEICTALGLLAAPDLLFGAGLYDILGAYGLSEVIGATVGAGGVNALEQKLIEQEFVEAGLQKGWIEAGFEEAVTIQKVKFDQFPLNINHLMSSIGKDCGETLGRCDEFLLKLLKQRMEVVSKNKNLAGVETRFEGEEHSILLADSGKFDREGFIPNVGMPENPKILNWTPLPGKNNRDKDSEYKIFNFLANQYKGQDLHGDLIVYSELPICVSCGGVIDQFHKLFPHVNIHYIPNWL